MNYSKKTIGAYLAVSGSLSLFGTLDKVTFTSAADLILLYPLLIYAGMILGGVLLFSRSRRGLWIAIIPLYLQLLFIQVGRVTYSISSNPGLELQLWPQQGVAFSTSSHVTLFWHSSGQPFYLGMNLIAGGLAGALAFHIERHEAAVERLAQRKAERQPTSHAG